MIGVACMAAGLAAAASATAAAELRPSAEPRPSGSALLSIAFSQSRLWDASRLETPGRWAFAAAALALAMNIKYVWPGVAALLALWLAMRSHRGRSRLTGPAPVFVVTFILTTAACWWLYADGAGAALATASMFARGWTFNAPVFELFRGLLGSALLATGLAVLTLLALIGMLVRRGGVDLWQDGWLLSATALLLSPVAYPWYFLWIVPLLVLAPSLSRGPAAWLLAWMLGSAGLHLLVGWNHLTTGIWDPMPRVSLLIAIVPVAGLCMAWRSRLSGRSSQFTVLSSQLSAAGRQLRSENHELETEDYQLRTDKA